MGTGEIVPLQMSTPAALKIIRAAATDPAPRVAFLDHALKQMRKRRITRTQVLRCLEIGSITEGPTRDLHGNWTCRVERLVAGDPVGVVVAIEPTSNLIVITAFMAG
jgi:hypothetical protein